MIPLLLSRRTRNEVREWLSLAEDVRDFAVSIGRLFGLGRFDEAEELLKTKRREMEAGRAAHEASKLAGAAKSKQ